MNPFTKYDVDLVYLKGKYKAIVDALMRVDPLQEEEAESVSCIPGHYITATVPVSEER